MTGLQLLRTLGHRWYIVAAGLILSVVAVMLLARATGPVYSAQTDVVFSAPGRGGLTASADGVMDGLVGLASAVQRDVGGRIPPPTLTTDNATLFGSGVSKGYTITLPNIGGQWQISYNDPKLTVSVVGPDPGWVRVTSDRLVAEIQHNALKRQIDAGVPDYSRIVTGRVPKQTSVSSVSSSTSTDARAMIAVVMIGLSVSGTLAVLLDRRQALGRKRNRHATRPSRAEFTPPPARIETGQRELVP